jgi:homoaconitate hydratase
MGQTVVEKITQAHLATAQARPVRTGDFVAIRPKHVMTHDNTSAVLGKFRAIGATRVRDPRQPVFALDHDIQNREPSNLKKYATIEAFAREQGIDFYPAGTGIGHQLMIEQAYVTPGSFVVASDSHSNTYGAVGAVGTPIVRTDAAAVWCTGEFWWQVPRTVQVVLEGALRPGVTGKDLILTLCGLYNQGEVLNAAVEFAGPGVAALDVEARLTVANMTTEWGALVGWFPADETTFAWYEQRHARLTAAGVERLRADDLAAWRADPPRPDPDAAYAGRIAIDLATVQPFVSGPDTVQVGTSVAALAEKKIAVHKAYIVSCVNSRQGDLAEAARVLRGRQVAPGVRLLVAAASREVEADAQAAGDWQALLDAGAEPLPPSCGPCIGLGTGLLEPGEVGISATNRNFKGRMGSRDARCYLGSPAVVAASAAAGYITAPPELLDELAATADAPAPARRFEALAEPAAAPGEIVEILPGFPAQVRGRLVFVPQDNLNTDGIYGKDYTYREDLTREDMARVVMENYDPTFAARVRAGDVLVGGFNFGTGSSREQAATALIAKGIPVLAAGTYSDTYLRNAYNNGFPCIQAPALVRRLREQLADRIAAGEKTIIPEEPGDEVVVDFTTGTLRWRGETFRFPALGPVPQSLVVAGGVENLVRQRLGLG